MIAPKLAPSPKAETGRPRCQKVSSLVMKNSPSTIRKQSSNRTGMVARLTGLLSVSALTLTTALHPLSINTVHAQDTSRNYIKITSANASVSKQINLGLNKSLVVDLPADANDVLVANPSVADAVMRTSRRIYLFGKEIGQTNIFIFDGKGDQIASMEIIIERDIAGLETSLKRLIPNSDIKAEMINDNIVLTGTVGTPLDATRAVNLAQIFIEGGEQSSSNSGATGLAALFGETQESSIVNLLKIQGQDQVMLKVTIAEIQRLVTKQLGLTASITGSSDNGFSFQAVGAGSAQQSVIGAPFSNLGLTYGSNSLLSTMQAMEIAGVMRTLAEPSLTAVSGEEAEFRVGGSWQIPSQISTDENGTQITYETTPYGVYLKFTPTVLSEGRISLNLQTEVQEPSPAGASSGRSNANLWGSRNRRASTTVELPSGGSMAIAGLVQDDIRQVVSGLPGMKNIPIFGSLFRSREFIRNETELVMIITPYLVRPTARKNLAQPDENFQPASEGASVFMGRVNRVYGTKQGNLPKGRYTGSIGFILK